MIQTIKQKLQGSVLVFTLLALSVLLLGALSLATATLVGQKNAKNTDSSMQAFQTADSGAERILAAINNNKSAKLSALGSCTNGVVTGDIRSGSSQYKVSFFDENGDPLDDCANHDVRDIREIKSVGEFAGTTRAIKTAVAAGGCGQCGVPCSVVKNSGKDFEQKDYDEIENFMDDGYIVAMKCMSGGGQVDLATATNDFVAEGLGFFGYGSGVDISCFGGFCEASQPDTNHAQCDDGWDIVGIEPC